ncbi:MAG: DUF2249 domain-containing protein [Burkholderiales bacterium]
MPDGAAPPRDERILDLRGLEPPEPLMRVFAALDAAPDQPLRVRMLREPFPLYAMLRAGGWRYRTVTGSDGCFEILISRMT